MNLHYHSLTHVNLHYHSLTHVDPSVIHEDQHTHRFRVAVERLFEGERALVSTPRRELPHIHHLNDITSSLSLTNTCLCRSLRYKNKAATRKFNNAYFSFRRLTSFISFPHAGTHHTHTHTLTPYTTLTSPLTHTHKTLKLTHTHTPHTQHTHTLSLSLSLSLSRSLSLSLSHAHTHTYRAGSSRHHHAGVRAGGAQDLAVVEILVDGAGAVGVVVADADAQVGESPREVPGGVGGVCVVSVWCVWSVCEWCVWECS